MKKHFAYILLLLIVVAASCKKQQASLPASGNDKAVHKVGITVTGFTQTYQTLSNGLRTNAGGAPPAPKTVLYQLVYDNNGDLVKTHRQLSTDTGFGTFTDSLATGNYTVVFLQIEDLLTLSPSPLNDTTKLSTLIVGRNPNSSGQLYEKKLALTVNTTDVSTSVTLDRVVGQLQVMLTDPLPANVASITVHADSIQSVFSAVNQSAYPGPGISGSIFERQVFITPGQIGTTNFTVTGLYFIQTAPIPVTIYAQDAALHTLASVRTHVTLKYNQITLLKGSLFGNGNNSGGANITFDPSWDPTPINVSF